MPSKPGNVSKNGTRTFLLRYQFADSSISWDGILRNGNWRRRNGKTYFLATFNPLLGKFYNVLFHKKTVSIFRKNSSHLELVKCFLLTQPTNTETRDENKASQKTKRLKTSPFISSDFSERPFSPTSQFAGSIGFTHERKSLEQYRKKGENPEGKLERKKRENVLCFFFSENKRASSSSLLLGVIFWCSPLTVAESV